MVKVTVLMSAYNSEVYLSESIESVLNQTYEDFEFLIINDASTDKTQEVILSFDDPRIRVINNEYNIGLTRSLNKGLALARGEFIARQDADDISDSERLQHQVNFLEDHPEVVLLGSWYREIDAQDDCIGEWKLPVDTTQIRWDLLFYTPFIHSSIMMRKTIVLQEVGSYNEGFIYSQDHEFWVRISKKFSVANLNKYLLRYRVHPSSITLFHETRQYELLFQSCSHYMATLLQSNNISDVLDKERYRRIQYLLGYSQYQNFENLNLAELRRDIELILKLSQSFCNYYHLDSPQRRKHQANLTSTICSKLISLASISSHEDRHTAGRLLLEVFLFDKASVFSRKFQKAFLKFLAGPSAMNRLRKPDFDRSKTSF